MFCKQYTFGTTTVYYIETPVRGRESETTLGLAMYPSDHSPDPEKLALDSMVQVAFRGDDTLIDYSSGVTMRNRVSTILSLVSQCDDETGVITRLTDGKGNFYTHHLEYDKNSGVFSVHVEYENRSDEPRTLEMLSSFSLSGIGSQSDAWESVSGLKLRRLRSAWSRECRPADERFCELGLDPSWAHYGVKCERWGQVGSMPNRGWYPFAAIEDEEGRFCLGVQTEAPSSWQLELYLERHNCAISGGQGDFEFAHWQKTIPAGSTFCTHKAFLTVKNDFLSVCNVFLKFFDSRLQVPESEEDMPVLFNEYCTTWGNPTEENIEKILAALQGLKIGTFMIDCGWFKPEGKEWGLAVGDWVESKEVFPHGIHAAVDKIHAAGMNAGIWFEFEIAGRDSELFHREDLLLKRDGKVITTKNRRFLDLRKPEAERYLQERLIDFLKKNEFSYIKIDYNDAYGLGCDGAESLGEGGRQVAEESLLWLNKLRDAIPGLVIENCASGGSRIEPLRMSKVSMCSFSDAHECAEIPFVAANVALVVPARQIQIWSVLRKTDLLSRIIYSMCAGMFGRICLSGDVPELSAEQMTRVCEGLDFYEAAKEIVRYGQITRTECTNDYYRRPKGWQVFVKKYKERQLVLVHCLLCPDTETVRIPLDGSVIERAYTDLEFKTEKNELIIHCRDMSAGAFLLKDTATNR